MKTNTELAIIGAGPAGLAAAEIAVSHGISVTVIDEQPRPGGQIYRQPPAGFQVRNWLSNTIYKKIRQLVNRVTAAEQIQWLPQTTVLAVLPTATLSHRLILNNTEGSWELHANCVLIAAGCYDMPAIFPGSNLPGVMATGGIQAFVKSQQLIPGERFLFVGTHPLQLIVADQIVQAGGRVAGIVFAQSLTSVFSLLKSAPTLLRHSGKGFYFLTALARLLLRRIPIHFSRTVKRAHGDGQLQSVDIAPVDSSGDQPVQNIRCDRLGVCFGFLASSELARQAGAKQRWSPAGGGWIIEHDQWMRTTVPGLFVAGELTGVGGADVSMLEGKLAGLGAACELNKLDTTKATALAKKTRSQLHSAYRFADLLRDLSYPGKTLLLQLMTNDSTLCKCEEISVSEFKNCLAANPFINNANAAKLASRAGMGLCQGRYCNYYISSLMTGVEEPDTTAFTARFPVKPVTIKSILKQRHDKSP